VHCASFVIELVSSYIRRHFVLMQYRQQDFVLFTLPAAVLDFQDFLDFLDFLDFQDFVLTAVTAKLQKPLIESFSRQG
jgi:hypothetical protein